MANTVVKYQKYAEYKDSGVEWLGEIPKGWEVLKLKYALDLISEKSSLPLMVSNIFLNQLIF